VPSRSAASRWAIVAFADIYRLRTRRHDFVET
jgi:hypothetical protein